MKQTQPAPNVVRTIGIRDCVVTPGPIFTLKSAKTRVGEARRSYSIYHVRHPVQNGVRTAPNRNGTKQFFTVIHPFHPWRGQRFDLVEMRRCSGDWRVFYINKQGNNASLPASWTDAVAPELFIEMAQGKAIARVRDLVQLAELVAACVKENKP